MAGIYKIGSLAGYNIAKDLLPGQSQTVGDGSVWTKNADGTISVLHNGNQLTGQITYNPVSAQQNPGNAYIQQNVANMTGAGGYVSPYAERLNTVIAGLQDSKWEGWDPDTDPSMQAYRKQYLREADRTAEDVLGQYAQNTGGIAGSQAIGAATQASDYYKSQLADKIPQLYENAYSRYLNEVTQQQNMANLLMNAESQANSQYYQRISYALNKWAQMGYADQEVASVLGVSAGTPTSDQVYSDWSTAFQAKQYQDSLNAVKKGTGRGYTGEGVPVIDDNSEETGDPARLLQQAKNLDQLRNIVTSSPTYSAADKEKLAWQYYDEGLISEAQLRMFLKENGLD